MARARAIYDATFLEYPIMLEQWQRDTETGRDRKHTMFISLPQAKELLLDLQEILREHAS